MSTRWTCLLSSCKLFPRGLSSVPTKKSHQKNPTTKSHRKLLPKNSHKKSPTKKIPQKNPTKKIPTKNSYQEIPTTSPCKLDLCHSTQNLNTISFPAHQLKKATGDPPTSWPSCIVCSPNVLEINKSWYSERYQHGRIEPILSSENHLQLHCNVKHIEAYLYISMWKKTNLQIMRGQCCLCERPSSFEKLVLIKS